MTTSPESDRPKYRRVLLKLSGESFATEGAFGIHPEELASIAGEIASAMRDGLELAIVVGGGTSFAAHSLQLLESLISPRRITWECSAPSSTDLH